MNLYNFLFLTKPSIWIEIVQTRNNSTQPIVLLRLLFHATITAYHLYVGLFSLTFDLTGVTDSFTLLVITYSPLFITFWNYALQALYFLGATIHDILIIYSKLPNLQNKLNNILEYAYSGIVFPYVVFVFSSYWILTYLDPDFLTTPSSRAFVPNWFDHSVHTFILANIIIESCIGMYPPTSQKQAFQGQNIIFLVYIILFVFSKFVFGHWIYILLNFFTTVQLVATLIFIYIFISCATFIGVEINKLKCKYIHRKVDQTKIY